MEKNFEQFYNQKLLPTLEKLEEKRLHNKKILYQSVAGSVAIIAFSFLLLPEDAAAIASVLLVGAVAGVALWKQKPIKDKFKNEIVASLVKFIDESLYYNHAGFIPQSEFNNSLLFRKKQDRYKGDDLVKGKIGQTDIEFSELHAEYKTTTRTKNGQTQTHWHTIFKGIFIIADFHKDFSFKTLILPNDTPRILGGLGRKMQKWAAPIGKIVQLEDVEFSKYFVVYSENQVEARYLISTAMMQRMLNYRKKWNRTIHISLIDSKLYMAISMNKNLFEYSLFKSFLNKEYYTEMVAYMNLIIDVVHDLNLNLRIWTKN